MKVAFSIVITLLLVSCGRVDKETENRIRVLNALRVVLTDTQTPLLGQKSLDQAKLDFLLTESLSPTNRAAALLRGSCTSVLVNHAPDDWLASTSGGVRSEPAVVGVFTNGGRPYIVVISFDGTALSAQAASRTNGFVKIDFTKQMNLNAPTTMEKGKF